MKNIDCVSWIDQTNYIIDLREEVSIIDKKKSIKITIRSDFSFNWTYLNPFDLWSICYCKRLFNDVILSDEKSVD